MVPCLLSDPKLITMISPGDTNTAFEQRCKEIAARFLYSVVVLDDLARMGVGESPAANPDASQIEELNFENAAASREREDGPGGQRQAVEKSDVPLEAKPLIDGFANLGLVCAVLNPSADEIRAGQWANSAVVLAAKRADIVVLDWKLGRSQGTATQEIMRGILEDDSRNGRLRLFAIYTGEPGLHEITGKVKATIDPFYGGEADLKWDDYSVSKGPVRAVVIPKLGNRFDPQGGVPESSLPDRLVAEFATMTGGILRNLALAGLAAIRDDAHRILAKFEPRLDAAYLSHRTLLPSPSDAEDQMLAVLGSELLSVLEDSPARDEASLEVAKLWIDTKKTTDTALQTPVDSLPNQDAVDGRLELLTVGAVRAGMSGSAIRRFAKKSAESFIGHADEANRANREFAALLTLKTHYPKATPKLTLGTVIREHVQGDEWLYYLCLQPKCDAVRLEETTGFPLLPLPVQNEGEKFSLVLRDENGNWIHVYLDPRPSRLNIRSFDPRGSSNKEIVAQPRSDTFVFKDIENVEYEWLAELKSEHAMRVAGDVSASLARPGPDYSEWLRRAHRDWS